MRTRTAQTWVKPTWIAIAMLLGVSGISPAFSQSKPPESTSKVKRVLLYNKIGGWIHSDGTKAVQNAMRYLSAKKGFELVESNNVTDLTSEFLKTFQVIVWNNNTNGASSVPDSSARESVIAYLKQGGGWLLLHGASDHQDTWPDLKTLMGTKYTSHVPEWATFNRDTVVLSHPELRWMAVDLPSQFEMRDWWDLYQGSIRQLPGITVLATIRIRVGQFGDLNTRDLFYSWARQGVVETGKGRMIYNGLGHGGYIEHIQSYLSLNDSLIPRMYWENLRYAAGDYQNGCTDPSDPKFDPSARVYDGSCVTPIWNRAAVTSKPKLIQSGRSLRLTGHEKANYRVECHDTQGRIHWLGSWDSSGPLVLDSRVPAGLYQISLSNGSFQFKQRILISM